MLQALEDQRGEPRNKPPFPGTRGLWGQPTLINNVETLAVAPGIVARGGAWWKAQGVRGAAGLKLMAVSGDVERPGVYGIPMGTTVAELIDMAGGVTQGRNLPAFAPGGASSNFLGPDQRTCRSTSRRWRRPARCSAPARWWSWRRGPTCSPWRRTCRVLRERVVREVRAVPGGIEKADTILSELIESGGGPGGRGRRLLELEKTMRLTSICGLGQVALGPAISVLGLKKGGTEARPRPPRAGARSDHRLERRRARA